MLNPSTATVSTAAVTGPAAFFTCARLGLALATVRFVTFPRAALDSLRVLGRAVVPLLFWTFDDCFLRLAMIDPSRLVLRKALMPNIKSNPAEFPATYPMSYQQMISARRDRALLAGLVSASALDAPRY